MANRWGNNGNSGDFIFLGSKITADGDYRLDSVLKSKDITLQTKIYTVKAMVFPVVMFGCESWTIKKALKN